MTSAHGCVSAYNYQSLSLKKTYSKKQHCSRQEFADTIYADVALLPPKEEKAEEDFSQSFVQVGKGPYDPFTGDLKVFCLLRLFLFTVRVQGLVRNERLLVYHKEYRASSSHIENSCMYTQGDGERNVFQFGWPCFAASAEYSTAGWCKGTKNNDDCTIYPAQVGCRLHRSCAENN